MAVRRPMQAAMVVIALFSVAGPTATAGASSPVLAGINSVSVRDTAAMRVTLPRDLSFTSNRADVTFPRLSDWAAISLYALASKGEGAHPMLTLLQWEGSEFLHIWADALPAGEYLLVLTSGPGKAVTAELKIPGLDGSAAFAPSTPFPIRHRVRAARPSQIEEDTIVVSAMNPTRGAGFGVLKHSYTRSSGWMGNMEQCLYDANRDDLATDAEPGCPGGQSRARVGRPLPFTEIQTEEETNTFGVAWSFNRPLGYGEGWNHHTFMGDPPEASITTTWLDFADAPAELLVAPGSDACAADAADVPAAICSSFAPFRRARGGADRLPRGLSTNLATRYGLRNDRVRRLVRTKMGPLYLAPGPKWSCAVLSSKVGTFSNCRQNRFLLTGMIAFTFTGRTDRTLIAALLPDGARRLRLKLKGRARGSVRLRGNAAIAYTSFRRYRGGTLRWVNAAGRSRSTRLPH